MRRHPVATSVTKALLATAAFGGALTIAAVAPGLVGAWSQAVARQRRAKRDRYNDLWQSFYRLKKEKKLEFVGEEDDAMIYKFTDRGKVKLHRFLLDTLEIVPPVKWDGKWRVLIFDIPEKYKYARRALQRKLDELGFFRLQKSVWTHPFPCEAEIGFIKDLFNIKPWVEILYVKEMPNGRALYHFRLLLKEAI